MSRVAAPRIAGVALGLVACFGSGEPATNDDDGANEPDAASTPMGSAECAARCDRKVEACRFSVDCVALCAERVSRAAMRCIEALDCSASVDAARVCVRENPEAGPLTEGSFGDACECAAGESECQGVCAEGLSCASTAGLRSCIGPVCCEGASCTDLLGTTAECGAGRVCGCADGSSTCARGLCVADH